MHSVGLRCQTESPRSWRPAPSSAGTPLAAVQPCPAAASLPRPHLITHPTASAAAVPAVPEHRGVGRAGAACVCFNGPQRRRRHLGRGAGEAAVRRGGLRGGGAGRAACRAWGRGVVQAAAVQAASLFRFLLSELAGEERESTPTTSPSSTQTSPQHLASSILFQQNAPLLPPTRGAVPRHSGGGAARG